MRSRKYTLTITYNWTCFCLPILKFFCNERMCFEKRRETIKT